MVDPNTDVPAILTGQHDQHNAQEDQMTRPTPARDRIAEEARTALGLPVGPPPSASILAQRRAAAGRPMPLPPLPPKPRIQPPTMLTVAEAAAILRVSKMTVYRMIHRNDIPAQKVGQRSFRVREDVVLDYIGALPEEEIELVAEV